MQCGFFFCILLTCIVAGFATMTTLNFTHPAHPGKCSIYPDIVLSPGERIRDPGVRCGMIQCYQGGFASLTSCDGRKVGDCDMDLVSSVKEFPDCCEMKFIKCAGDNKDERQLDIIYM